jgi:hypothetical protein
MTGDGNHEIWEGYNFEWLKNRAILMQSTGLHDKNGKEIFEGDIVRLTHKQRPKLLQVVFESGRFDHWETMDAFRLHTEVIGNIYQNPEPLK